MKRFISAISASVFVRMFFLAFFSVLVAAPGAALEMTPELLFTQIEERTERVDSIEADVQLASGAFSTRLTLSIQGPDKFAMDFIGGQLRVVFDGERLWIYIAQLREVFTLESGVGSGLLTESLREWVNPRKIITNLTRKTLFTVFDIELLSTASLTGSLSVPIYNTSEVGSSSISTSSSGTASSSWRLRFTPHADALLTKLFDIGSYEMTFSGLYFLPTYVVQFSPEGVQLGTLAVRGYRLNESFPKDRFVFEVPAGVTQVPVSEVLAQKFEGGKDLLFEGVGRFFRRIKDRITDWGM
ncbi:MAG: hypothetical protein HQM09_06955 [Candidatus Riflebacteria bacterium]|nr:hypothetical protein [Candidatus Riflebacteria bacterium]